MSVLLVLLVLLVFLVFFLFLVFLALLLLIIIIADTVNCTPLGSRAGTLSCDRSVQPRGTAGVLFLRILSGGVRTMGTLSEVNTAKELDLPPSAALASASRDSWSPLKALARASSSVPGIVEAVLMPPGN